MGEEKPETLDFVKDFQEYLSQQTQHVNMISGSVSGVKEVDDHPAGNCKRPCFIFDLLFPYNVLWVTRCSYTPDLFIHYGTFCWPSGELVGPG